MSLGPVEFDNTSATFTNMVIVSGDDQAASCTPGTGAFRVAGGASIAKNLNVGGDTCITGDVTATDIYATDIYATDIYSTTVNANSAFFNTLSAVGSVIDNLTSTNINVQNITLNNEVVVIEQGPTLSVNLPYSPISIIFDGTIIDVVNEKNYSLEIRDCRVSMTGTSLSASLSSFNPGATSPNHGSDIIGVDSTSTFVSFSTPVTAFANGGRLSINLNNTDSATSFTFSASTVKL